MFAALCPRRPSARVSLVLFCEPSRSLALCTVGASFLPLTALANLQGGQGTAIRTSPCICDLSTEPSQLLFTLSLPAGAVRMLGNPKPTAGGGLGQSRLL